MNKIDIDRRKLVKMGLTMGAFSLFPFSCIQISDQHTSELLKFISHSDVPVNEKQIGELTSVEFKTLSSLCSYVNQIWELTLNLDQYLQTLNADLKLKTNEVPSYLTEYKNAIELVDLFEGFNGHIDDGWSTLLFGEFTQEDLSSTKIGRARRLVFSEIITHFVPISGGFKAFGLMNYRGYFGGSYASPESYRKMKIG